MSGTFPITIGAANQYGSDSRTLTLNLASALPVITQPITIDLSGQSGGTDVLGQLICTALETVGNVIGLVDVLNQILGLVGGLVGGLIP